jgi:hypothetical protein
MLALDHGLGMSDGRRTAAGRLRGYAVIVVAPGIMACQDPGEEQAPDDDEGPENDLSQFILVAV